MKHLQNLLTLALILVVVLKLIDFSNLAAVDIVILTLMAADIVLTVVQLVKGRNRHVQ